MADFMELAERVEALSVGDRSLDAKIALAVLPEFAGWIEHPANNGNQYGELAPSRELFYEWLIHNGEPCLQAVASYTASLDAAMTLVPEGWDHGYTWQPGSYPHMKANGQCWTHKEASTVHGDAATPALALCAAALRARASNG